MKKTFLQAIAIVGVTWLAQSTAFAASYQVHVEPTVSPTHQHTAMTAMKAHYNNSASADIISINFTRDPILVVWRDYTTGDDVSLIIPSRSSGYYSSSDDDLRAQNAKIYVRIYNSPGPAAQQVWAGWVNRFDTLSVYVSDGLYVVNDIYNPPPP